MQSQLAAEGDIPTVNAFWQMLKYAFIKTPLSQLAFTQHSLKPFNLLLN